jgi:hypothetical protein
MHAMPSNQPSTCKDSTIQSPTRRKAATIGVDAGMIVLGLGGLTLAIVTGGAPADLRAAYTAGTVALILAILLYGIHALRTVRRDHIEIRRDHIAIRDEITKVAGTRTAEICEHLNRLEARLETNFDQKIDDGLMDRLDQLESVVMRNHEQLAQQAERIGQLRNIVAALIDELRRRERDQRRRDQDELDRKRRDRNNS